MKFKKLVLISTSTTIAGASLIALAAACHDKNQKNPGNNKQTNLQKKTNQTSQEQEVNRELIQKQTDNKNQKQEKEGLSALPSAKQPKVSKNKKDQLNEQNKTPQTRKEKPKLSQNNKSTENPKQNLNSLTTPQEKTQKVITKPKEKEKKNLENQNSNSVQKSEQTNTLPNKKQKLTEIKQDKQKIEEGSNNQLDQTSQTTPKQEDFSKDLEDKDKTENSSQQQEEKQQEHQAEVQLNSDVEFIDNPPVIKQEADYSSQLKLKVKDSVLSNNSSKVLKIILVSSQNNKEFEGKGYYNVMQESENKNVVTFSFGNINPNWTYYLKAITVSDDQKESAESKNLELSTIIKKRKINVEQISHTVELDEIEKVKKPVTITAKVTKNNSGNNKYNVVLTFTADNNEINGKYASVIVTHGDYNNWGTINNDSTTDYQIQSNKITIPVNTYNDGEGKEFQVKVQRIADSANTYINSSQFRINYKIKNAIVDKDKNLVFKISEKNITN